MTKEQAIVYLRFSGFSDEQIKAIEGAFTCDKCVYSTREGCQYDDITETIPPFEPCEDAISRKEAISIAGIATLSVNQVVAALKKLPSVKPQKPCKDAISREAVLKIYDEWFANCNIADKKESPKSKIKALPPVTPQPKMGHWIFVDEAKEHARCSECNSGIVDLFDGKLHNYCEVCGTQMY